MVVRFIPVGTTCGHQLVRTISFGSCIFTAMTKTPKVTNLIRDEVYFGSSWFQRPCGPWTCLGQSWLAFWACGEAENIMVGRFWKELLTSELDRKWKRKELRPQHPLLEHAPGDQLSLRQDHTTFWEQHKLATKPSRGQSTADPKARGIFQLVSHRSLF